MQIINLDMSGKERAPLLHAKQGDVGRRFLVTLTDNGGAYDVPDGAKVSVWYSGASGTGNYTDIGEESAVTVSGNEILVELIAQMLLNPGAGFLCLVLHTSQGEELGCWNIPYYVEARPGMNSAEAQAYFTAFSKAVGDIRDGKDGYTPQKGIDYFDGAQGPKGEPGEAGKSAYQIWLDAGNTGSETAILASLKGIKGDTGAQGEKGENGADGHTPVKGVDYYTEADKTEMVSAVMAALPVGEGVAY